MAEVAAFASAAELRKSSFARDGLEDSQPAVWLNRKASIIFGIRIDYLAGLSAEPIHLHFLWQVALAFEVASAVNASKSRLVWFTSSVLYAALPFDERPSGEGGPGVVPVPTSMSTIQFSSQPPHFMNATSSSKTKKRRREALAAEGIVASAQSLDGHDPMSPDWRVPRDSVLARAGLQVNVWLRLTKLGQIFTSFVLNRCIFYILAATWSTTWSAQRASPGSCPKTGCWWPQIYR